MVEKYITYQTLLAARDSALAARDSADWAFWAMLGTGAAAVATVIASIIAILAMFSWQKQIKVALRLELKKSIGKMQIAIETMPEKFTPAGLRNGQACSISLNSMVLSSNQTDILLYAEHKSIKELFNSAKGSWYSVNDSLNEEENLAWNKIETAFKSYYGCTNTKEELVTNLDSFLKKFKIYQTKRYLVG